MAKDSGAPIYYFDSCLFLALVNQEQGRWKTIEILLDGVEKGECHVFTSYISITEVCYGAQEKAGKALSDAVEKRINKLWHPASPVRLIDVHPKVTLEARSLIRAHKRDGWLANEDWSLKPADAIHLATARILKANYLFTYDAKLIKLNKISGLDIRGPFLKQGVLVAQTDDLGNNNE